MEEAAKEFPKDRIEIFYVIRVENETYSGPSFTEFVKQFERNKKADW